MKNNTEKSEKSVFIRDKIMMMPFVCGKEYYFGKKFENALLYFVTFLMVLLKMVQKTFFMMNWMGCKLLEDVIGEGLEIAGS